MGTNSGVPSPSGSGVQFVWVDRVGYVRIRTFVRSVTVLYILITAVVTVLTSDLLTLVFLGVLALGALTFASPDRIVSPNRRVHVYSEDGFYIAEHLGTGKYRHGESQAEALANLDVF